MLNILLTESQSVVLDWATVIEVLLGAVVGFTSNMMINLILKRKAVNRLLGKLSYELKSNYLQLKEIKNNASVLINFTSPIWDLVVSSDVFLDIPVSKYEKIVNAYVAIKQYEAEEQLIISAGVPNWASEIVKKREELLTVLEKSIF
jgi:hypothetical protein